MNETDEMDAEVQAIDLKISKKQVTIEHLEGVIRGLEIKVQRHKSDLRKLGELRAEKSTFKLL